VDRCQGSEVDARGVCFTPLAAPVLVRLRGLPTGLVCTEEAGPSVGYDTLEVLGYGIKLQTRPFVFKVIVYVFFCLSV
jgi:hypothetical protein